MKFISTLAASAAALMIAAAPLSVASASGTESLTAGAQSSAENKAAAKVRRYVVDQANMLSDPAEQRITEALARLHKQQDAQVVVVTVDDLRGRDITDFAQQLSKHWGVAIDQAEPGMMMIVAPNEQKVKLHVGPGLEAWMPDEMTRYIIANYMFPSFSQRAYQDGVVNGTAGIVAILGQETPIGPKLKENGERADAQVVRTTYNTNANNQQRVSAAAATPAVRKPATSMNADAARGATGLPLWALLLMPLLLLVGGGAVFGWQRFANKPAQAPANGAAAPAGASGFAA